MQYGTPAPMKTLEAFNRCVLQLGRLARERGASEFMTDGLQSFHQLVPFASAWWGEMSNWEASAPPQNWMHGQIGLSETFASEWNAIAGNDSFCHYTLSRPGEIARDHGFDDPSAEVNAFARRYDLFYLMNITFELPESGLMFFVCLYRGAEERAFTDDEAALFSAFSDHLLQLWRFQVQDMISQGTGDGAKDIGVARLDGSLLYVGARLCATIQRQLPDWNGSMLPASIAAHLNKAPCVIRLGRTALTLSLNAEHVILSLKTQASHSPLAPREMTAAMLFADGHSYKEIARILSLSPATVRTYLRNCYLQLGVKSKVELGSVLRNPMPQSNAARRDQAGSPAPLLLPTPPHL